MLQTKADSIFLKDRKDV